MSERVFVAPEGVTYRIVRDAFVAFGVLVGLCFGVAAISMLPERAVHPVAQPAAPPRVDHVCPLPKRTTVICPHCRNYLSVDYNPTGSTTTGKAISK